MNTTKLFKVNLILLGVLLAVFGFILLMPTKVHACDSSYGGGDPCIINKSFDIEKKVRIEGDNTWKDKITLDEDERYETIEFRIVVENTTDDGGVDDVSFDDMRMEDILPDELIKVSGDLTEEWDDFEPGEERTFKIKVKVDEDEYDRENFDKCVVNEAIVEYDGNEEGSDTATVCFGSEDVLGIQELPDTGASATIALTALGLGLISGGITLKRKRQ